MSNIATWTLNNMQKKKKLNMITSLIKANFVKAWSRNFPDVVLLKVWNKSCFEFKYCIPD